VRPTLRRLALPYLCLLCLALLLAGCSNWSMAASAGASVATAANEERGLGQTVSDDRIQLAIVSRLFEADAAMLRKVDVSVHEGRVLLAGVVEKPEMRVTAVQLAWQEAGVTEVIDEIKVAQPEDLGEYVNDVWLAQELRNTLLIDRKVRSINYSVDCVAGTIYLMGVAQDQAELQRVIDHARDIPYVRGVISFVRLKNDPARLQSPGTVQPVAATP